MQASGAEIPRGEERAHPFWPMLVASTAVLPFLPRVLQNEATELLLHGAVAAAVWYTARRLGVHYGTAIVAGLLFGVLPQHVAVLSAAGGRRALVAALVVFLAWGLHAGARGPGIRRTIAAPLTYLVALLVDPSVFAAPILFWAEVDLRRDVSRPLRFGAARHLPPYLVALAGSLLLRSAWGAPPRVLPDPWIRAFGFPEGLFDLLAGLLVAAAALRAASRGPRSRTALIAGLSWAAFRLPAWIPPAAAAGGFGGAAPAYLPAFGLCLLAGHALAGAAGTETETESRSRAHAFRVLLVAGTVALAIVLLAWNARKAAAPAAGGGADPMTVWDAQPPSNRGSSPSVAIRGASTSPKIPCRSSSTGRQPAARAPATSTDGTSPTNSVVSARAPIRSSAMAKMRGSGFSTPTTWESTTVSNSPA